MENNKVSFEQYRKTNLNFASKYGIEGPLSKEAVNDIVSWMNKEYLDESSIIRAQNYNYISKNENINNAIQEIRNYNINSYLKSDEEIKLSDAVIKDEQKQVFLYLEDLINEIKELPQEEAINSYIKLKDIIEHGNLKEYAYLNQNQKRVIESIVLPVSSNIVDFRKDPKQLKKVA